MDAFDRSVFKAGKMEGKQDDILFWQTQMPIDRLKAAYYLNSIVYGFSSEDEPRIDRGIFKSRRRI